MINVTPPERRSTFLREGRGIILFMALFVALACLISFKSRYESYTRYSATPNVPLNITATPGQEISVTITAGPSLNGFWAGGLGITLDPPASFSTELVAPRDISWSGLIFTDAKRSNGDVVIDGSFTVPAPGNAGVSVLRGKISGGVIYPIADGLSNYSNQTVPISIPVMIQLISPSTAFIREQLPLYLAGSASILILLVIPVFYRIYKVKRKRARFQ